MVSIGGGHHCFGSGSPDRAEILAFTGQQCIAMQRVLGRWGNACCRITGMVSPVGTILRESHRGPSAAVIRDPEGADIAGGTSR